MKYILSDFDFYLPAELIAVKPSEHRGESKMLHIGCDGKLYDRQFGEIVNYLRAGDVLVLNNTKVLPVQLSGLLEQKGGKKVDITLVQRLENHGCEDTWKFYGRPAKYLEEGAMIRFTRSHDGDNTRDLIGRVSGELGEWCITFIDTPDVSPHLAELGAMPLPPYIVKQRKRGQEDVICDDFVRYQTVYAEVPGSVAAPTAGLHFTDEILATIKQRGIAIAYVTLHVGLGTFLPVRDIATHVMHEETFSISNEACMLINRTVAEGGRVVAVGTTTLRVLETVIARTTCNSTKLEPCAGSTNIFIKPGYHFRLVDVLITNFHLPKSTLLMLVSAFAGYEAIQKAYQHAIAEEYRFFSYGDACFIEKPK